MNYTFAKKIRFGFEHLIHALEPKAILDKEDFPWHSKVESSFTKIKKEVENLLPELEKIINFNDVLPNQRALKQNDLWKTYFLKVMGEEVKKHSYECPESMQSINQIPGVLNAFFSILRPGVEIPEHRGPYAGVIRYHMGVIIPKGDVGIKVNGEVCRWKEGESLFFDDSFNHEAWNRTEEIRVILFVDIIRPLPIFISQINKLMLKLFSVSKSAKLGKNNVLLTA